MFGKLIEEKRPVIEIIEFKYLVVLKNIEKFQGDSEIKNWKNYEIVLAFSHAQPQPGEQNYDNNRVWEEEPWLNIFYNIFSSIFNKLTINNDSNVDVNNGIENTK